MDGRLPERGDQTGVGTSTGSERPSPLTVSSKSLAGTPYETVLLALLEGLRWLLCDDLRCISKKKRAYRGVEIGTVWG